MSTENISEFTLIDSSQTESLIPRKERRRDKCLQAVVCGLLCVVVLSGFVLNILVFVWVSAGCEKHVVPSAFREKMTGQLSTGSESATRINQPTEANKDSRIETFLRTITESVENLGEQMRLQHVSVVEQLSSIKDQMNNLTSETEAKFAKLKSETEEIGSLSTKQTSELLGTRLQSLQNKLQSKLLSQLDSLENSLCEQMSESLSSIDSKLETLKSEFNTELSTLRQASKRASDGAISQIEKIFNASRNVDNLNHLSADVARVETTVNKTVGFLLEILPVTFSDQLNASMLTLVSQNDIILQTNTQLQDLVLNQTGELTEIAVSIQAAQRNTNTSMLSLSQSLESISDTTHNLESFMVKMNENLTTQTSFLDTLNSSFSELTAQVRRLPDQILSLKEETTKDSSVQFCATGKGCKQVWHQFNQHRFRCFKLSADTASWPNAKQKCESMGGYLAEVLDSETLEYVLEVGKGANVWLGASDQDKEGDWRWAHSGLKVTINFWTPNQPDNYDGNEDCLHLWTSYNSKWNDAWCSHQFKYLCEKFDENCDGWD